MPFPCISSVNVHETSLYDLFDGNSVSCFMRLAIALRRGIERVYFLYIRLFHLTMPLFWLWFLALVVHLQ